MATPQSPIADDIIDPEESHAEKLDRRADAYLAEDRAFEAPRRVRVARRPPSASGVQFPDASPRPLRAAIPEDLHEGRLWMVRRADHAREAVQDEPIRASLYALGAGVLIGLLLRR